MSIALDLASALDPVTLSRRAGINPDPWQEAVLRSTAPQMLLNCSRQSGKSTTVATIANHVATYQPGSLTLLVSPGERQSRELFRKVIHVYRALGKPVAPEVENKLELELANGSRIVALPGSEGTVRSFSGVGLLLIDEAARASDDLYRAVRPMLAVSGGRLILLSTPWGKRGFFHREWTEGGDDWQRVKITAYDCPRITPQFLAQERRSLGQWWFNQEYLAEFEDTVTSIFPTDLVLAAATQAREPFFAMTAQPDDEGASEREPFFVIGG